ncbi:DNA repair protein RecO [Pleurocapsa sp. CCALA 161]|uniref:DNA repair protein RecO n=1 Tax=Pleurocapsa sp. CCALA 161 TaxID=2107688 RepID=UPI000D055AD7|nr:DNA repair protein RecO [Pleurocapsa sp. CCALA 161]PSB10034.1 DNA repair protein RecO [Pleurocapsa sp. CCALA 161]
MNQKYKAIGIVLKGSSFKENDRLVTVLTPEYGLIRAIAPGAKKYKSQLRGRTELFVINEFLIIQGRSLDKIIQANTVYTYPGLSRDIGKLATAQYLAELSLALAVAEQPQPELYELLNEHLRRIEGCELGESVYPYLAQAVFHLVAIAGLTPQLLKCCVTQEIIHPNLDSVAWQVGFSFEGGGIISLNALQQQHDHELDAVETYNIRLPQIDYRLNGLELSLLQQLINQELPATELFTHQVTSNFDLEITWSKIEKVLREYIQYHIGKTIRSAKLIDNLYIEF